MHPLAQAHPIQKLCDVLAIGGRLAAEDSQGQGGVVEHRQVLKQTELLEDHSDPAAQEGQVRGVGQADVTPEQLHATP